MKIGFIGLGKMGKAMVLNLLEKGVDVVAFNRSSARTQELVSELNIGSMKQANDELKNSSKGGNFIPAYELKELVGKLEAPRIIWLMVEHGRPVDSVITSLTDSGVSPGDIIIDGGNSFYQDSIRRHEKLKKLGIHFMDVGTSGGLSGARNGACLMIGGDEEIFIHLKDLFSTLSVSGGYEYFGPAGSGHFVKMVHNGVEYGMLEAIGEGFELLAKSPFPIDLEHVARNWSHGSVVRGWLMELLSYALKENPGLTRVSGTIGGGTTGEWMVNTARSLHVEVPVIKISLEAREKSLEKPSFSGKIISALRFQFGRHTS